ncbi:hypothetical protein JCM14076_11700 [Methylosoma difficile]
MNRITLTIMSQLANARLAALCAREIASPSFDETALAEIEVAVVETVNNCIEHACAGSEENKITIAYLLADDRLSIEVSDSGKVLEADYLLGLEKDFDFDPTDFDNLPEGGMGLKIIKSCMDEVHYQNTEDQNRWILVKYRPAESAS